MPEHDPRVLSYSHLRDFPRATDALQMLRRVASLVKPLMRARRWTVGELAEFYPDQPNLLGLNVNKGQKILVRLRYPGDRSVFLPLEQVADTMLHELAHIVHGPHDATFHALWNQLRDEHMALTLKGYTGEGFLSEGRRLGSGGGGGRNGHHNARIRPMDEARRLARIAAERRQQQKERSHSGHGGHNSHDGHGSSGGHRLGGTRPHPGTDIRRVVAEAAAARGPKQKPSRPSSSSPSSLSSSCATAGYDDQARRALEEQAARNGFRTAAEEEAANDAAIAQALWELVQEDERQRLGPRYLAPTAVRPEGSGSGRSWPEVIVVGDVVEGRGIKDRDRDRHSSPGWTCRQCTLHNPGSFLCCDVCGMQRPYSAPSVLPANDERPPPTPPRPSVEAVAAAVGRPVVQTRKTPKKVAFTPSTSGGSVRGSSSSAADYSVVMPAPEWMCSFCGRVRERQWWMCDLCGKMKETWQ
ncbi:zinc metallopeptidase [Grosmannia clavigera kw1407]|uniref:Zinc metallopeptidase n=1 Tax=Grosmannia clavigera (strain kw1407 / UAMH 11150) TaxID=655863 RepID=F0XDG7_GROCL|nr:zinc metallopeptidase [Grosmannia clavigera kw1407]EFX03932.1 zinc metallopeptidase [Grosmannia clavigera kw1407]